MPRSSPSISSASSGVSTEVGSSRIRNFRSSQSCLRISVFCRSPAESSSTRAASGTLNGIRARNASRATRSLRQSITAGTTRRDMTRFSATVMEGTSVKCW